MEDGADLHLARGLHRDWLGSGGAVAIEDAPIHFGAVSFKMRYDAASRELRGTLQFKPQKNRADIGKVVLHLRLPKNVAAESVNTDSGAVLTRSATAIEWANPCGSHDFVVKTK
jgi:hypothetical protein